MPTIDSRVDEYINKSAEFAKPILHHLRGVVHAACPDVKETIKWSFPNFEYAGSILCHFAGFKQHCSFGFWLASEMADPENLLQRSSEKTSMGSLGQIKSISDLPADDVLIRYINDAMVLNEKGVKIKKEKPAPVKLETPSWFLDALKQKDAAMIVFEKFSPSQKKEYIQWVTEAKTEATRTKRVATALEWIAEGKTRNWKYAKC